MTGAPSSVCPECGADMGQAAEIIRQKFAHRSIGWIIAGGVLIAASILYRLIYLSNQGFSTLGVAIGSIAVVAVVSAAGIDFVVRRPEAMRRVVFIIWLRSSFWLYLPWVAWLASALIANASDALTQQGVSPDSWAADMWRLHASYPCGGFLSLPIIAVAVCFWRWRSMHRKAMVPERGHLGPFAGAIICETFIIGCTAFDGVAVFIGV